MKILGIETSCDETAAAVIEDGTVIHSNVIASQVEMHARYGGIVPEIASRQHMTAMIPVVQTALSEASINLEDLDGIAVTHGPGLAGSLLVGVNAAKGLAVSHNLPFIGINHLEGHIYAAWLEDGVDPESDPGFPIMCLITSGGHTDLIVMRGHGDYQLVGRTRDDAAGEAFDKVARVLGLRYPGGPEIQRVAEGAPETEPFPRAWMQGTDEFSFSGLKTAVINRARKLGIFPRKNSDDEVDPVVVAGMARAFQDSVVDVLVTKTIAAAVRENCAGIVLVGGVAANRQLRETLVASSPVPVAVPPVELCTDNGAMIAMSGRVNYRNGRRDAWDLDVIPNLRIGAPTIS